MRYFKLEEFNCKHTGNNEMNPEFLDNLDRLRERCGFPFVITSGYRDVTHPVEVAKQNGGGTHTQGIASDIAVSSGYQKYMIVKNAIELGFTGIGIAGSFIHVDMRKTTPVVWSY